MLVWLLLGVLLAPHEPPPGYAECLMVARWLAAYYVAIPDRCDADCAAPCEPPAPLHGLRLRSTDAVSRVPGDRVPVLPVIP